MSRSLGDSIQAMDRLNSWVRSKSFRHGLSGMTLQRHIYRAKGDAIRSAHSQYEISHRPFTFLAKCRSCNGTGVFTHEYCYGSEADTSPCRTCSRSGVVRLDFVETRIWLEAPICWHSPRHSFPLSPYVLGVETNPGEWTPNQPGREMTPDEAARDLLLIDEQWPVSRWVSFHDRFYELYIGESVETCAHCGVGILPGDHRCGSHRSNVGFTFAACDRCRKAMTTEALFNVQVPQQLIDTQPNVQAWMRQRLEDIAYFTWEKERTARYA